MNESWGVEYVLDTWYGSLVWHKVNLSWASLELLVLHLTYRLCMYSTYGSFTACVVVFFNGGAHRATEHSLTA